MSRSRHAVSATTITRVIDVIPGPRRKAWQIALIEADGRVLLELRLGHRAPDNSIVWTDHRSVLRPENLRRLINALLAAADAHDIRSAIVEGSS